VRARLHGLFSRLRRNQQGVSAVEFALIAPVVTALLMGGYELTTGVNVDRKVTLVARTLADLTAQEADSLTTAELDTIIGAGRTVMAPYTATTANSQIRISSVVIDSNRVAKIAWTYTSGTISPTLPVRTAGDTATIDDKLKIASTSLIWAEVAYVYKPVFVSIIAPAGIQLKEQLLMRPRTLEKICYGTVCG
jgi:Flp pilus assembly protein TadG